MKIKYLTLKLLILIFISYNTLAASVVLLGLEAMQRDAEFIFHGECISVHESKDTKTDFVVTFTTFKVVKVIKGNVSNTYTIKQFGGAPLDNGDVTIVSGVPRFEIGEEYVIFLPRPSSLGFSSPIGLSQGIFDVAQDRLGSLSVSNGRDFSELLPNSPSVSAGLRLEENSAQSLVTDTKRASTTSGVRMALDEFVSIVKAMEMQP